MFSEAVFEHDILCLDCHRQGGLADGARAAHLSHPVRDLILRSDPKRMSLIDAKGELEEFGAIGCVTCHGPHRWTPPKKGNNLQMQEMPVRRPGNLIGPALNSFLCQRSAKDSFCVDCHGIEALLK